MRHGSFDHPVMPKGSRRKRKFQAKRKPLYIPPITEAHLWMRPSHSR